MFGSTSYCHLLPFLGQTSGDILSWDNATFKNYGNIEEQGKEATNYFLFTEQIKFLNP